MREISWEEYYEKFYDWSESTQKSRAYSLMSYGSPDEVFEIAQDLSFGDEKFAARFLNKTMDFGVRFTPEQTLELTGVIDETTVGRMAETAAQPFSREQLEEINMLIDDEIFSRISKKAGIDIFEDENTETNETTEEYLDYPEEKPAKIGFFTKLMAVIGAGGDMDSHTTHKHNGRCNGDCAHCPPHYGYRYGRWYYGHGHQYGCEFGGNKGDGGL